MQVFAMVKNWSTCTVVRAQQSNPATCPVSLLKCFLHVGIKMNVSAVLLKTQL